MTAAEIIACAPFRLGRRRPLTAFEWTVVRHAIARGFWDAGSGLGDPGVDHLFGAVRGPHGCQAWRTSAFGPAPAVSRYAYRCLGAWFAGLDPASRSRALSDIIHKRLLCSGQAPWAACPTGNKRGRTQAELWEGAPQPGKLTGRDERCAAMRRTTSYVPMSGQQMLELFRSVGGQLPPKLEQAAKYGAQFLQRDFLVGIQIRKLSAAEVAHMGSDPLAVARKAIDSIALIWAPGKGASIRFLLQRPVDPQKMVALFARMMPDLLPEALPGLEKVLPGLVPPPDDPLWDLLFGSGFGQLGFGQLGGKILGYRSLSGPSTAPNTGSRVVDEPGSKLDTEPPPIPGLEVIETSRGQALLIGIGVSAVVLAFGYRLFRR